MQNVISDPVFGLSEKGIQKENVKNNLSGMLVWSIPEGCFLKKGDFSQPNEKSFGWDWKIVRLRKVWGCQPTREKAGFNREKTRLSRADLPPFFVFYELLDPFFVQESGCKMSVNCCKGKTDKSVMAEVSGQSLSLFPVLPRSDARMIKSRCGRIIYLQSNPTLGVYGRRRRGQNVKLPGYGILPEKRYLCRNKDQRLRIWG